MKAPLLASVALALGLATTAVAQEPVAGSPAAPGYSPTNSYGLLGAAYAGVEAGYTRVDDGLPQILHRYGFFYNQPLPQGLDLNFKYDYSRASALGVKARAHEAAVGLTGYLPLSWGKPFVAGDVGWIWQDLGGAKDDSFAYQLKAGVEFQTLPALVITPYVAYKDAPHFSDRFWVYGAKATYRFTRQWGASIGAELDEHHNTEYILGVNYHY